MNFICILIVISYTGKIIDYIVRMLKKKPLRWMLGDPKIHLLPVLKHCFLLLGIENVIYTP